ncbi:alpha/beta hydrolase [Coralloluteibacterium stylophorae]|uniref:Alpha/beta hydrolase n=1 Tax=Coralloluteibacterium stylophorae TaxID=1776034 RepID=A0A8J7VSA8_9GAMM|nr:alpha/beta hydrolase [Coralloluteibacterium stylophorae]MBS7456905.1 alpha/beta hydrolase [Coralloluteibacterium stylophorae]
MPRSTPPRAAAGLLACLGMIGAPVHAQERPAHETAAERASRIELWPGGLAPGDVALADAPRIVERSADPALPDRAITRVGEPYLVVYRPQRPDGSALLVTPGGGYARVVLDKEGSALVPDFVEEAGVTLFVLRYRLPGEGHPDRRDVPLADAQRAMRLIRARAADYGVDPRRVGVMGFSAGGHVAASLATRFDAQVYPQVDAADAQSARPDLQILVYPVIDMGPEIAHPGSRDNLLDASPSPSIVHAYSAQNGVRADAPPAFLLHAQDDEVVPAANSLVYAQALLAEDVSTELHLFPRGGHGFGVRGTDGLTVAAWPRLAVAWMRWQYAHRRGGD